MKRYVSAATYATIPAALVVIVLLAGGLSVTLLDGLGVLNGAEGARPTLVHFRKVLTAPGFLSSLGLTTAVATISTAGTVLIAIVTAFAIRRVRVFRRPLTYLYQLPLTVPHIVIAAAAMMLLSQSGLFARAATAMGFINEPAQFPALINDRLGIGIIIVYVWKQVPFVGLFLLAVLQTVGEDYEAVARTLGAGPWQTVRYVLLPLVVPALVPAGIIIFAFVFGAFEVPLLLGTRYPSMLSVLAYRLHTDTDLSLGSQSMALSLLIAVFTFVLVGVYRRLARGRR